MIDIREYGATTSSPDNTTAIQAAIDAAASSLSGAVIVPPGQWNVLGLSLGSGAVLRIDQGATLKAISPLSISILANADPTNGNEDIRIELLGTIDGNGANQTDVGSQNAIKMDKVTGLWVVGPGRIKDMYHRGIVCTSCNDVTIEKIQQRATVKTNGISFATCTNVKVLDCLTCDNLFGSSSGGYGLFFDVDCETVLVERHLSKNNSNDCLVWFNSKGGTFRDCDFINSTADKGAHVSEAQDTLFENCRFNGNFNQGINTTNVSTSTRGLVFRGCDFSNNAKDGFNLYGEEIQILDSKISGNALRGMRVRYGSVDCRVERCLVTGNGDNNNNATKYDAIDIETTGGRMTIKECSIRNNSKGGVVEDTGAVDGTKVIDCEFYGNLGANTSFQAANTQTTETGSIVIA